MPTTDLLKTFGLSRNPFTDRTAEKTQTDPLSLYVHSDLRAFRPNDRTYVFFGRRGSGKTTIRLQMEDAYRVYNEQAAVTGKTRGHYIVDLSKPGHLTACLASFQVTSAAALILTFKIIESLTCYKVVRVHVNHHHHNNKRPLTPKSMPQ